MGYILREQFDYDSVRYALGLEKDQARLLTDNVIEGFPHLPMAEAEAISRYTPPTQSQDVISVLLARDPSDLSLNALKAGVCMLTCAFLCGRLEVTIPQESTLQDLGSIKRVAIKWRDKEQSYISKGNWFFSLIDQTLAPHNFPSILQHGHGRIYQFDPEFRKKLGFSSDLSGYIYPSIPFATSGGGDLNGFLYGFSFSI